MGEYHTREAFETRMLERRTRPQSVSSLAVFYHISCMPGWEPIVAEQLALLSHVGLMNVKSFVVGSESNSRRCWEIASAYGVRLEVLGSTENFGLYEGPTLKAVHEWSKENIDGAVLYFHTKGVSDPTYWHKQYWRRIMQKHVVADWKVNLKLLQVADILGCAWQEAPDYPHFCGNFWAARCDWLAQLTPLDVYRSSRPDFQWAGAHSWCDRMYVETWLGSEGWHHVEDKVGMSYPLWQDSAPELDIEIEGFDYFAAYPPDGEKCDPIGMKVRPITYELHEIQNRWDRAGIPRATCHEEMAFLANGLDRVVSRQVPGVVLECGAFTGFSSACLSVACERVGRRLVVADSFAGLPYNAPQSGYSTGQYACDRRTWEANIRRVGRPRMIDVRAGWYAESLQGWNQPVALLWLDVDLGTSVGDVLRHVLSYLSPGALIFSHESRHDYFDDEGQIISAVVNEVWQAILMAIEPRKYRATFHWECLAELEILE